jgi:predicted TIM-barrel fold metal-dependent hydrolase
VHVFDAAVAARGGHYRRSIGRWRRSRPSRARRGAHLVLVQPSVYGSDNSLMLQRSRSSRPAHAALPWSTTIADAELDAMHARGVRGVRSTSSRRSAKAVSRRSASPRWRRACGDWVASAVVRERAAIAEVAELHRRQRLTCVLDHLAGFGTGVRDDHPAWQAVEALAAQGPGSSSRAGTGWTRRALRCPGAADPPPRGLFGERMVWGSDWPHTHVRAGCPAAMPRPGSRHRSRWAARRPRRCVVAPAIYR